MKGPFARRSRGVSAVVLTLLLGLAPASAYHVNGAAVPGGMGFTSHHWQTADPTKTLNLIVCESNGMTDPINPKPAALTGTFGLCFMSRGSAGGLSNGNCPQGAAVPANGCPISQAPVADTWVAFDMVDAGGHVSWQAEAGDAQCDVVDPDKPLRVNQRYLFWQTGGAHGHVRGLPFSGDAGGYTVAGANAPGATATPCDEPNVPVYLL